MIFAVIGAGIVIVFFVVLLVRCFAGCFLRGEEVPLESLDLSKTHYAKYKDELLRTILEIKQMAYEPVRIRSYDGLLLGARFYDFGFNKTVIALHGYRAIPYNNIHAGFLTMKDLGYNVLLVSHRAHYDSEGRAITFGEREQKDLTAWLDYVSERRPDDIIALYGLSMGCATICLTADKLKNYPNVKLLVLESGYRRAYDTLLVGAKKYGAWGSLVAVLCRLSGIMFLGIDIKKSKIEERLRQCDVPAYFIHGSEDRLVVPENAKLNFEAIGSAHKKLYIAEGAGHAEAFIADRQYIEESLKAFAEEVGA